MTPRLADSGCVRYVDLTTLSKTNVAINVTCIVVSDNMSNMAVGKYCVFVCLFVFVYLSSREGVSSTHKVAYRSRDST